MSNASIKEVIQSRHSVRNYNGEPLSEDIIDKINTYIRDLNNPFNEKITIELVKRNSGNDNIKLGTYGVIKGANYFLVAACKDNQQAMIALGYSLEKVILYCTSLGLGTVWLGGTFKRSDFAKAIDLQSDEVIPIVSPVGYEGGKKSLLAALMGNNNKKRKDFSQIFFDDNFDTPLTKSSAGEYFEPLEMVRIAPSAVNKQPWRVVKHNNRLDFYLASNNTLNSIDIGIALCHFHLVAIENKLSGEFTSSNLRIENPKMTYVISWIKA